MDHKPFPLRVETLTVGLPKSMDRRHAIKDASFDLHAGDILRVVGESGSGKSATAKAVT